MGLKQKLKQILEERFPAPDIVEFRHGKGIIGVVTSSRFRRMTWMKRQNVIDELLESRLSPQELRRVASIVALTPEEEKVQRAIHDWNGTT